MLSSSIDECAGLSRRSGFAMKAEVRSRVHAKRMSKAHDPLDVASQSEHDVPFRFLHARICEKRRRV